MAKDEPKNGRRTTDKTTIRGTRASPPTPRHKTTGKKDPGGFKSPGFKSEGFTSGGRKVKTGPPPSVRARDEKREKQPPSVKYATKKKSRKQPDLQPLDKPPGRAKPKSQAAKRRALAKIGRNRRTGTTSTWPSSKRMTYKGMSADTRSGSFPTSSFAVSHEQKKRPTRAKRGR